MQSFILIVLFFASFMYRFNGLANNDPFWVDEFASADQSLLLFKHGLTIINNAKIHFEHHNITTYFLTGIFFKLFGLSEFVARLPHVIIGSIIPLLVFILAKKLFGFPVGLGAALLTTFSYFQITWSRQAREYMILQALILSVLIFYHKIVYQHKKNILDIALLGFCIILGLLTHSFFIIVILALFIDYLFKRKNKINALVEKKIILFFIILTFVAFWTGTLNAIFYYLKNAHFGKINNVWYYHSFLWREYGQITLIAIIGTLLGLSYGSKIIYVLTYTTLHIFFLLFLWEPYHSKYLLPIFPLLLIMMAYALYRICIVIFDHKDINELSLMGKFKAYKNEIVLLTYLASILFIIINGNKFVIKPKTFYSVNHDFREIALVDYHKIYTIIQTKKMTTSGQIAMIDTWPARSYWYLGQDVGPIYILRWKEAGIYGGGQNITRTTHVLNSDGEKIVPKSNGLRLVEDVVDLKSVIKRYDKGFIYIDDATLPRDVIDFAEKNFKKELYLDHYPLDDNPYSIWPATLYSWGFD